MVWVPVSPVGRAVAAALIFRMRGQRWLTTVAKATFALVPEGRMTPVDPDAIATHEVSDADGPGLRSGGDLAPYLGAVDVTVVGHAELAPHCGDETRVELAIVRGSEVLLDRQLTLDATHRTRDGARQHVQGMAPLSAEWPVRARLRGSATAAHLTLPELDLPDDLDLGYFQTAPAEQRVGSLRGDEWIVLGGFFLRRPRVRTELPNVTPVARLYRREAPNAGEPLLLRLDMLQIDLDRRVASLVWRGSVPLVENEIPSNLHVVAGIELPGQILTWASPFALEHTLPSARSAWEAHDREVSVRIGSADLPPLASAALTDSPFEHTQFLESPESGRPSSVSPVSSSPMSPQRPSAIPPPMSPQRASALPPPMSPQRASAIPPPMSPQRASAIPPPMSPAPGSWGWGGSPPSLGAIPPAPPVSARSPSIPPLAQVPERDFEATMVLPEDAEALFAATPTSRKPPRS